jgi:hypothetical protein
MAIAIKKHGVDLSIGSLRRHIRNILIEKGYIVEEAPGKKKVNSVDKRSVVVGGSSEKEATPSGLINNSNKQEDTANGNLSEDNDERPQWIKDKEKNDTEQYKALHGFKRNFQNPELSIEDRQRLQEEYVRENARTIFKTSRD